MSLSPVELESVLKGIWTTVLGSELNVAGDVPSSGPPEEGPSQASHMSSCVQFSGDWQGAVRIDCPSLVARRIAAIMFAMDAEALSPEEVRDALGEIANMAGGNIKPLLRGKCQLSLPAVTEGMAFQQMLSGAQTLFKVDFDSGQGPLADTVLSKEA